MYRCPRCSSRCYSFWRRASPFEKQPITCKACGAKSRLSAWDKTLEHAVATLFGFALAIAWFLVPGWQLLLYCAGGLLLLYALLDLMFPLIPSEAEGSPEDMRRSTIHVVLAAVPMVIILVLVARALLDAS